MSAAAATSNGVSVTLRMQSEDAMPASKKYPVAALAMASILAAVLVAGCKKTDATGPSSKAPTLPLEKAAFIRGTVDCNDESVPCGYVLITKGFSEDSLKARPPKRVPFDWAEIEVKQHEGKSMATYSCVAAPVGDVKIMIITDPDEFASLVNDLTALNEKVNPSKRGPGGPGPNILNPKGSPPDPGSQRSQTPSNPRVGISSVPPEKPESSKDETPPPNSGSGSALHGGLGMLANHDVGKSIEKTKEILSGLSNDTKELLEKINKKYGNLDGALKETTTEAKGSAQRLDLHLKVE